MTTARSLRFMIFIPYRVKNWPRPELDALLPWIRLWQLTQLARRTAGRCFLPAGIRAGRHTGCGMARPVMAVLAQVGLFLREQLVVLRAMHVVQVRQLASTGGCSLYVRPRLSAWQLCTAC